MGGIEMANIPKDLDRKQFDGVLAWDHGDPSGSLDRAAVNIVFEPVNGAITWYFRAKKSKKFFGQWLRIFAWLLGGVAVIVPIAAQIKLGSFDDPAYASVAILVAGGLIWLDRFLGLTSGWLRYISAGQRLLELKDTFAVEWALVRAGWSGGVPTQEQVLATLNRFRELNAQIHAVVRAETEEWIVEFRDSLKQLDASVKARADELQKAPGSLEVKIANAAALSGVWALDVDARQIDPGVQGATKAISDLPAGTHAVRVMGTIRDSGDPQRTRAAAAQGIAIVESGKKATLELTLA